MNGYMIITIKFKNPSFSTDFDGTIDLVLDQIRREITEATVSDKGDFNISVIRDMNGSVCGEIEYSKYNED
jgi:hypothetical protein